MVPAGRSDSARHGVPWNCWGKTSTSASSPWEETFLGQPLARFGALCFLWGYIKSVVYTDRPRTLVHLKNNITGVIANMRTNVLERMDRNFRSRLVQCIDNEGRHLTDVIFKTNWKKICDLYCKLIKIIKQWPTYFRTSPVTWRQVPLVGDRRTLTY